MSDKQPWVYISGPYSGGDTLANVRRAVKIMMALRDAGYVPICPHLSHFAEYLAPRPYDWWLDYDMALLEKCDYLVRLPGESPGADKEVDHASELGLGVIDRQIFVNAVGEKDYEEFVKLRHIFDMILGTLHNV